MLVTSTLRRDLERYHGPAPIAADDHRARHIANAREWLRREAEARAFPQREGVGNADAIHAAAQREAKAANVELATLLPAVLPAGIDAADLH